MWLCEELGIPYELKRYDRHNRTMLAPAEYKALHPLGAASVITDNGLALAESGVIMEYIIARHGEGRFAIVPDEPDYSEYLYWLQFVNGTLQPNIGRNMILSRGGLAPDSPIQLAMADRQHRALSAVATRLGEAPYLAQQQFSAADMMIVVTLTTMRYFAPFDLQPYPHILDYLGRLAERPAYRAGMENGDPGMVLLLS